MTKYLGGHNLLMGHQEQDGEKVGQISLFDWKLEVATERGKQKIILYISIFQLQTTNYDFPMQRCIILCNYSIIISWTETIIHGDTVYLVALPI